MGRRPVRYVSSQGLGGGRPTDACPGHLTSNPAPVIPRNGVRGSTLQLPAGQNAIVAVMSYSGYDIEDALVINKVCWV